MGSASAAAHSTTLRSTPGVGGLCIKRSFLAFFHRCFPKRIPLHRHLRANLATTERCVDYGMRVRSLLIFDASILPRSMLPLYHTVQVKPNEYLLDGCSNIYTRGVDRVPIEITEP